MCYPAPSILYIYAFSIVSITRNLSIRNEARISGFLIVKSFLNPYFYSSIVSNSEGITHSVSYEKNMCLKPFNRITSPLSPYLRYRDMRRKKTIESTRLQTSRFRRYSKTVLVGRAWPVSYRREADSDTEHYPEPEIANENLSTTDEPDVKRNERYSNENIQASHRIYMTSNSGTWWQTTSALDVWRQIVTL